MAEGEKGFIKVLSEKLDSVAGQIDSQNRSTQQTASITDPLGYLGFDVACKVLGVSKNEGIWEVIRKAKATKTEEYNSAMEKLSKMSANELLDLFKVRNTKTGKQSSGKAVGVC